MRTKFMRAVLVVPIGVAAFVLPPATSGEEPTEVAPQRVQATPAAGEAQDAAAAQRSRRGRKPRDVDEWWKQAREVLFSGIELDEEQTDQVDAVIAGQLGARARGRELRAEIKTAQNQGDAERAAALRTELQTNRKKIKSPHGRIEDLRELLTEEQRPSFDMNRAHLVAEGQERRKGRKRPGGKRPAEDAKRAAE